MANGFRALFGAETDTVEEPVGMLAADEPGHASEMCKSNPPAYR
jgi:hypothetical protein